MKEKKLIKKGDPCTTPLDDPSIRTLQDAKDRKEWFCRFYLKRDDCETLGCVQKAGHRLARYIVEFYSEATEEAIRSELEEFRRIAPLPPDGVEAYIDTPDHDYRRITDPDVIADRVAEFARKVLDIRPGERPLRSPEDDAPPHPSE